VDDDVHFFVKYRQIAREKGLTSAEAVRHTFQMLGTTVLATTGVVSAGFAVFAVSHYRMSFEMGVMSVLIFGIALLMDFLLTPTLLLKLDKRFGKVCSKNKE
jgi:predicted RND superfamily exporter protein